MEKLTQKLANHINVLYPDADVYQTDDVEGRVYFELPHTQNDFQATLNIYDGHIVVYEKEFDETFSCTWAQINRLTCEEFNDFVGKEIFEMVEDEL